METQTANSTIHKDVYAIVTDRIIEQLNKGTVPWRQSWADGGLPANLISKRSYRGINTMLLAMLGYEHNLFLTFKQLGQIGGKPKKDEKPHLVVFWNYVEREQSKDVDVETEEETPQKKKSTLRYYMVFNISQCEGIPDGYIPAIEKTDFDPIASCEEVVRNMPQCPPIKNKEQKAYYDPLKDFVNMPRSSSFESAAVYYSTLFHELVHSTGHHSRLNRPDLVQMTEFGSEPYSREELVAEIGTCYLQSYTGVTEQFQQSTAYIQGWLGKLKNDRRFIFSAATQAQKAIDFILDVKGESEDTEQAEA